MYIYTYIHTCMHTHLCSRSQKDVFDDLDEEMTFGARGVYNVHTYLVRWIHARYVCISPIYIHIPCGMYVRSMRCKLQGALFITQNTCDEYTQDGNTISIESESGSATCLTCLNLQTFLEFLCAHVHTCIVRNMYVHMYIRIRACTQIVSMYIHLWIPDVAEHLKKTRAFDSAHCVRGPWRRRFFRYHQSPSS